MKIFTGKVISNKLDKTLSVLVERIVVHPLYKKRFKKIKKYLVHSENPVAVGSVVKFAASRPYSKLKRWKVMDEPKREEKLQVKQKPKTKVETVKPKAKKVSGKKKS